MFEKNNLVEAIVERLGDEVEVNSVSVQKNNGIIRNGVTIRKCGDNVAPTIYYDEDEEFDVVVDKIIKVYQGAEDVSDISNKMNELLSDVENVYSRVIPCLVNGDNAEDLDEQDKFHDKFLDMEVIYKISIDDVTPSGVIVLRNGFIKHMNVDVDVLRQRARKNLRNKLDINSMIDTIAKMRGRLSEEDRKAVDEIKHAEDTPAMYIISTNDMTNGAGAMLLDDVLNIMHDYFKSDEIVILPSSINEIIVIPMNDDICLKDLKTMVTVINATQVEPEDRLTNSIYIHNRNGEMEVF